MPQCPTTRGITCASFRGPVRSGFGMDGDMTGLVGFGNKLIRPFEISAQSGAKTSIFTATDPSLAGNTGGYWYRCRPGPMTRAARVDSAPPLMGAGRGGGLHPLAPRPARIRLAALRRGWSAWSVTSRTHVLGTRNDPSDHVLDASPKVGYSSRTISRDIPPA